MKAKLRLAGFVAAVALLLAGGVALVLWLLWLDLDAAQRAQLAPILAAKAGLLGLALVMATAAFAMLARGVFRNTWTCRPAWRRTRTSCWTPIPRTAWKPTVPPELRQFGVLINRMADQCQQLRRDVDEQVRAAMTSVEGGKEPPGRAHVGTEPERGGVQSRRPHLLVQQPRNGYSSMALGGQRRRRHADRPGTFRVHGAGPRPHQPRPGEHIQHRLRREGSQPVANFVTTTRAGQCCGVQDGGPVMAVPATAQIRCAVRGVVARPGRLCADAGQHHAPLRERGAPRPVAAATPEGSRASLGAIRAAVESSRPTRTWTPASASLREGDRRRDTRHEPASQCHRHRIRRRLKARLAPGGDVCPGSGAGLPAAYRGAPCSTHQDRGKRRRPVG